MGLILLSLVAPNAHAVTDPDLLFVPNKNAVSDRAAGIGKRIKPGGTLVLADIAGPAIIRHFWMTNVRAVESAIASGRVTIRFYWDGHAEPDVVVPLNEFFGRRFSDSGAIAFHMALGKNAYYIMPFRKAAKVEIKNDSDVELWGVYWQIDYDKVTALPDNAEYFNTRTKVAALAPLNTAGRATASREGSAMVSPRSSEILAELKGPAVIRRFALDYDSAAGRDDVVINRGVIVRMFWDGEKQPSVEVPLADLFGTGFGVRRDFRSKGWVQSGSRAEIRFPMPFQRTARIELANLSGAAVGRFKWRVDYEQKQGFSESNIEYFHACFRQSRPVPLNSTHVAMETKGRGKFVGLIWSCHWLNREQKPEGTQNFWIDGQRIQSTGSEDYFGRAWGFGNEPECHPYKGINVGPEKSASTAVPGEWRRMTAYRSHVLDPIHFQNSLKLDFTCYGYNRGHRTDDYATVCFWYQAEPHTEFVPLPPLEDLLPLDHPDSFGFGMYQIAQAEAQRDYHAAFGRIEALIQAYPRNPKAGDLRFKRGQILEDLGRRAEALAVFREIQNAHADSELARDAADKVWLLEEPGRLLLKAAAPSHAEIYIDGQKVMLPAAVLSGIPAWGHAEIYRFTYPPMKVTWDAASSAVMRLPTVRVQPGVGRHVMAVKASAAKDEPIFTPRVGYFFAALDIAGPDIVSDATWKVSEVVEGWERAEFDDYAWSNATRHPPSAFGDAAWMWLWPRGFRNFPGATERIWGPAVFPEEKAFREVLLFRKHFELPQ